MPAQSYDIEIERRATYTLRIEWRSVNPDGSPGGLRDTTGFAARMQIRRGPTAPVLGDFSSVGPSPAITVAGGVIVVQIGAQESAQLVDGGRYDLVLTNLNDPEEAYRLLEGAVTLDQGITDPV